MATAALVLTSCATAPPSTLAGVNVDFPSPLSGPGRPVIDRGSLRRLGKAWQQLEAGQLAAASSSARACQEGPHRALFELQLDLLGGQSEMAARISEITDAYPSWAAAWLTLTSAAIREGDESTALAAARHGGALWQREPWNQRATTLHQRWVVDRVTEATGLLDTDDPEGARTVLETALALDPEVAGAKMLEARILIALGRAEEAEQLLAELSADPEATMLRALMAETQSNWLAAMDLYQSLPADHPGRDEALLRAQLRWRLTVLPLYVHQALESSSISRAELAVILLALAPDVEALASKPPPLLSDIVELPFQREILTSVRVELIAVDPIEHRFHPQRPASVAEVTDAVEALCHLLGYRPPIWCSEASAEPVTESCRLLAEPMTGNDVATIVLALMREASG